MKKLVILFSCLFAGLFATAQSAKYKSVDEAEFIKVIAAKDVQLVDVRTAAEFKEGHIGKAINIDVKNADFDKKIEQLKKDKIVAIYCKSGNRSKIAAAKLAEKGYTVVEFKGGITAWTGKINR